VNCKYNDVQIYLINMLECIMENQLFFLLEVVTLSILTKMSVVGSHFRTLYFQRLSLKEKVYMFPSLVPA
jgi:hypothetical protein